MCYPILSYTILYYTIRYYAILYYTVLYYTILYYTMLYYTMLYYTILYYTILYYTILYYTILYYFTLSCILQSSVDTSRMVEESEDIHTIIHLKYTSKWPGYLFRPTCHQLLHGRPVDVVRGVLRAQAILWPCCKVYTVAPHSPQLR